MTTFKRWYLLLGFGVVLAAVGNGRVLQTLWLAAAFGFLTLVVLSIRASRRRSKRLFVDLPLKRLGPPPAHPVQLDHRMDAFL